MGPVEKVCWEVGVGGGGQGGGGGCAGWLGITGASPGHAGAARIEQT